MPVYMPMNMKLKSILFSLGTLVSTVSLAQEKAPVQFHMDPYSVTPELLANAKNELAMTYTMTDKTDGKKMTFTLITPGRDELENIKDVKNYNAIILPAATLDLPDGTLGDYAAVLINKQEQQIFNDDNNLWNTENLVKFATQNAEQIITGIDGSDVLTLLHHGYSPPPQAIQEHDGKPVFTAFGHVTITP